MKKKCRCIICGSDSIKWKERAGYTYFFCKKCKSIFIDPEIVEKMDHDSNFSLREYDENYWKMENNSAKERSWGGHWPEWQKYYIMREYQ